MQELQGVSKLGALTTLPALRKCDAYVSDPVQLAKQTPLNMLLYVAALIVNIATSKLARPALCSLISSIWLAFMQNVSPATVSTEGQGAPHDESGWEFWLLIPVLLLAAYLWQLGITGHDQPERNQNNEGGEGTWQQQEQFELFPYGDFVPLPCAAQPGDSAAVAAVLNASNYFQVRFVSSWQVAGDMCVWHVVHDIALLQNVSICLHLCNGLQSGSMHLCVMCQKKCACGVHAIHTQHPHKQRSLLHR